MLPPRMSWGTASRLSGTPPAMLACAEANDPIIGAIGCDGDAATRCGIARTEPNNVDGAWRVLGDTRTEPAADGAVDIIDLYPIVCEELLGCKPTTGDRPGNDNEGGVTIFCVHVGDVGATESLGDVVKSAIPDNSSCWRTVRISSRSLFIRKCCPPAGTACGCTRCRAWGCIASCCCTRCSTSIDCCCTRCWTSLYCCDASGCGQARSLPSTCIICPAGTMSGRAAGSGRL